MKKCLIGLLIFLLLGVLMPNVVLNTKEQNKDYKELYEEAQLIVIEQDEVIQKNEDKIAELNREIGYYKGKEEEDNIDFWFIHIDKDLFVGGLWGVIAGAIIF